MTVATEQDAKPQISEPPQISEEEVYYPSGDGKPMAENDFCRDQAIYCADALSHRYASDPRIYVAGNNFVIDHKRHGGNRI